MAFFDAVVAVELDDPADDGIMEKVASLPDLQRLSLSDTRVSNKGLALISNLIRLEWLFLNNTPVTDAGLTHLQRLTNLQRLTLDGTGVTDAGMVYLEGLSQLDLLSLNNTELTDAGLIHLSLTKLVNLYVDDTKVTDKGIRDLYDALPDVIIGDR